MALIISAVILTALMILAGVHQYKHKYRFRFGGFSETRYRNSSYTAWICGRD